MRMSSTISARDTCNVNANDLFQTGELVDGQTSVWFTCRRTDTRHTGLMLFPCSCLPSMTRTLSCTIHVHIQNKLIYRPTNYLHRRFASEGIVKLGVKLSCCVCVSAALSSEAKVMRCIQCSLVWISYFWRNTSVDWGTASDLLPLQKSSSVTFETIHVNPH